MIAGLISEEIKCGLGIAVGNQLINDKLIEYLQDCLYLLIYLALMLDSSKIIYSSSHSDDQLWPNHSSDCTMMSSGSISDLRL